MALYYEDNPATEYDVPSFGPASRDEGVRTPFSTALLDSALIGAIAGALVSVYWITGNGTAVVPTVLSFAALFGLVAVTLRAVTFVRETADVPTLQQRR